MKFKLSFSWSEFVIGLSYDRFTGILYVYPFPFVQIMIWSDKSWEK